MNKPTIILTQIVLSLWVNTVFALQTEVTVDELAPTKAHQRATDLITHFISNYHYKKTPLNDELSEKIFNKYLESLDPNRSYFLKNDIQQFSVYESSIDDALRRADVDVAYEIFKVFRNRVDERISFAVKLLDQKFDFTIDENYEFDRSTTDWVTDTKGLDTIWRKRVKNDVLSLMLSDKKPDEIKDVLKKRYEGLGRRTHQLNSEDVFQFFINAYTTSVEPHTSYFSPRTSENFNIHMSLSLEGIGAVLQPEDEYTVVREIITGGPADLSKELQAEDKITGVGQGADGEIVDVIGWRLDDVVDLIRGKKDSIVRLELIPKANAVGDTKKIISLTRNKIDLEEQAAKSSVLEIELPEGKRTKKIGVIEIPTFYLDFAARAKGDANYRSTTRDVSQLIDELNADGVEGIVIDLRGNGGGSLLEATSMTGLFIEQGPVVQVKDSLGRIDINEDSDPQIKYAGPLAILVNRYSASASEIFAGAIQDYQRGVIIGEPTFGKGTVQNLIDLNQYDDRSQDQLGHLKTTIAQFFRVSGKSTQHRGVVPDIIFPTVIDATDYGERAYKNALPWASVEATDYISVNAPVSAFSKARWNHENRISTDTAFQLLLEERQSIHDLQETSVISLLETKRREERKTNEDKIAARETRYKKALGLSEEDEEFEREDILLKEAARILGDLLVDPAPDKTPQLVEHKQNSALH